MSIPRLYTHDIDFRPECRSPPSTSQIGVSPTRNQVTVAKEQKKRVNAGVKKEKIIVIDHLVTSNSIVLNNEFNWGGTEWNKEREEIKLLLSKSKTIM